jgi:hypothetical protein
VISEPVVLYISGVVVRISLTKEVAQVEYEGHPLVKFCSQNQVAGLKQSP